MSNQPSRPPFIIASSSVPENSHQYPNSAEYTGHQRAIGKAAGLLKIGVNLVRLPSGTRSSWPHAEEKEEEFVYVLEGEVEAWLDADPAARQRMTALAESAHLLRLAFDEAIHEPVPELLIGAARGETEGVA